MSVRISICENKKLEDMKRLILLLCLSVVIGAVHAQTGRLDLKLPQGHPRYLTTQEGKKETQELIRKAPWAKVASIADRYMFICQWALKKLANYGFDAVTGIIE